MMMRMLAVVVVVWMPAAVWAQDAAKKEAAKDELAAELLKLTNEERAKQKRRALQSSALLTKAAQAQAQELAQQNNPQQAADGNATMKQLQAVISKVGYKYSAMGENIAFGHQSGADVLEMWLKTDVHRDNLHSARFTQVGIASAKASDGTIYLVQIFAAPARR